MHIHFYLRSMEYNCYVYATQFTDGMMVVDCCGAPSQPNVDNITKNSVALSWAKPKDDGGALDKYVVEMKSPKGDWVEATEVPAK